MSHHTRGAMVVTHDGGLRFNARIGSRRLAPARRAQNRRDGGVMSSHHFRILVAAFSVSLTAPAALSQPPAGMRSMQGGMMGRSHDSATMALMAGSHQLVMNHDRIRRTVMNLPNGVRTVTESDDPRLAALIREHVVTTVARVETGDDPGLPMETPALRAIFRYNRKVRTSTDTTASGIIVVQTSDDSATVAALQQHASEVSALVEGGMAAMRASMMKNGGMMMGGMRSAMPRDTASRPSRHRRPPGE